MAAVAAGSWCVAGWRSVVRGGGRGPGGRCGVWRVVVRGVGCRSVAVGSGAGRGRWSRVGVAVRWSGGRRVGSRVLGVAGGVGCVRRRCRWCRRGSCRAGRCGLVRVLAWGCAGSGRWSWSFRTPAARGVLGRAAGNGPEGNPGRNNHGSLLRRTPTSRIQSPIRFQRYPTKTPFSVVAEPGPGPSAPRWSGDPILNRGPGPIRWRAGSARVQARPDGLGVPYSIAGQVPYDDAPGRPGSKPREACYGARPEPKPEMWLSCSRITSSWDSPDFGCVARSAGSSEDIRNGDYQKSCRPGTQVLCARYRLPDNPHYVNLQGDPTSSRAILISGRCAADTFRRTVNYHQPHTGHRRPRRAAGGLGIFPEMVAAQVSPGRHPA